MRIDSKFKVRDIAGEKMIIQQGSFGADMTKIIALNDSAEKLFNELYEREFEVEDAAEILTSNYNVDKETAVRDVTRWIEKMVGCGVIVR